MINIENYVAELRVPPTSPLVGTNARDVVALAEGPATLTTVVRERFRRYKPTPLLKLQAGDVLLLEGEPDALERVVARGGLELAGQDGNAVHDDDEVGTIEGVVTADSALVGETPAHIDLRGRFQVNLLAISRSGKRITQRLRSVRFQAGDVVVLQGRFDVLPDFLKDLGVLPLAERDLGLGRGRRRWLPILILALAMAAVAAKLAPVAVAFFGAALALLLTKSLSLRDAYESVEWPILILLGALIPVSEAVRTTGATDLIAGWLSGRGGHVAALGRAGPHPCGGDGGHALPQQRGDRSGDGAGRRQSGPEAGPPPRPLPDGGGGRRGLRFPDAVRSPVQHAGHGTGRLPVQRLLQTGPAVVGLGGRGRHSPYRHGLAPQLEQAPSGTIIDRTDTMKVADFMTRHVEFIEPDATIQDAVILMGELDVGALPLGSPNRPEGRHHRSRRALPRRGGREGPETHAGSGGGDAAGLHLPSR